MIFLDAHVTDEEYENETITVGDEKFNPKHLTDTFKTKHGTLNEGYPFDLVDW